MSTPLKDRIRSAAILTPALTALLGTNPFRWYDTQLRQGSLFPAVVVQFISTPGNSYSLTGRMQNSQTRVQYTIWGQNTSTGVAQVAAVEDALATFWDSLNLIGIPGLVQYPNYIVAARDGFVAAPQPGNMLRLIDVMMTNNDSL